MISAAALQEGHWQYLSRPEIALCTEKTCSRAQAHACGAGIEPSGFLHILAQGANRLFFSFTQKWWGVPFTSSPPPLPPPLAGFNYSKSISKETSLPVPLLSSLKHDLAGEWRKCLSVSPAPGPLDGSLDLLLGSPQCWLRGNSEDKLGAPPALPGCELGQQSPHCQASSRPRGERPPNLPDCSWLTGSVTGMHTYLAGIGVVKESVGLGMFSAVC